MSNVFNTVCSGSNGAGQEWTIKFDNTLRSNLGTIRGFWLVDDTGIVYAIIDGNVIGSQSAVDPTGVLKGTFEFNVKGNVAIGTYINSMLTDIYEWISNNTEDVEAINIRDNARISVPTSTYFADENERSNFRVILIAPTSNITYELKAKYRDES